MFFSCSHKKQLVYIDNSKNGDITKIKSQIHNNIEIGDVLKN